MKMLHSMVAVSGLLLTSLTYQQAWANVFNMGSGLTSLEMVPVGDAGNAADTRFGRGYTGFPVDPVGYGSVGYAYNIGKYEVTAGQYTEFLNKVAGVDTYGLYNSAMWSNPRGCQIERFAGSGTAESPYQYRVAADWANRPVNYVSFWDGVRFANWLQNGQPCGAQDNSTTEDGAYALTAQGITNNTVRRNGNWKWAVASEDEWYKAAYYKSGTTDAGYWLYPTGSDTAPGRDMNDASGNNGNYWANPYPIQSPYYTTVVGEFQNSGSPYGTFDQGGNVREWNDAVMFGSYRGLRGGSFLDGTDELLASGRGINYPTAESDYFALRVVQAPEPASVALLAVGGLLIARRRA